MIIYPPLGDYKLEQEARHVRNDYEYPLSFWNQQILDKYAEYLKSPILDVGCRNGIFLDVLKEKGYLAFGIELTDIADFAIKQGRNVIKGDIQERTPFADKQFKTVIMSHVLEHLPKPKDGLREVMRILNGYLFVHLPITQDEQALRKFSEYVGFSSTADVCDLLMASGFKIAEVGQNVQLSQFILAKT